MRLLSKKKSQHPRIPPPPPLPEPSRIQVQNKAILTYVDVKPADYDGYITPTIVLVHGCPGSYKDFRYLIPLLQQKGARVVALNLPGFDDSVVIDTKNRYEHVTAQGVAEIAYAALAKICEDAEHVFLVGHSFGGHTVTNLAALNLHYNMLRVRGVGFLASAGHTPPQTFLKKTAKVFAAIVRARVPTISPIAESIARTVFTKVLGFPDAPKSHFVSALIRSRTTNYDIVNQQRQEIAHIPAFVAWAKDDRHIQEAISTRLSKESHPGPRYKFGNGGHNIQKTKAVFLADELAIWINGLVAAGGRHSLLAVAT